MRSPWLIGEERTDELLEEEFCASGRGHGHLDDVMSKAEQPTGRGQLHR